MNPADLLTLVEAADIAKIKPSSLAYAVRRGHLPATKKGKTWLVTRAALDAWIADPDMHRPGLSKGQKINRRPRRPHNE